MNAIIDNTRKDPTVLMRADKLTRHYAVNRGLFAPKATVRALEDISFELYPARTLAVVGESGCGKSTLARQVTFMETPTAGRIELHGKAVALADRAALKQARAQIQIIFQDPYGSLNPRKKIRSVLEEPLIINTKMSAAERRERVDWMMRKVGLRPEHGARYPHMFSGGQRQRIAIARALMLNPKVVVADEPVSALDVSVQAQVLNLLMDLGEEFGVAYLFVSHDLSVVQHIADDVMVMYLGRTVEFGAKKTVFETPLHPYTRALMAATPRINPSDRKVRIAVKGELPSPLDPPTGCAFHTRCPHQVERCVQERPALRAVAGRQIACHRAENVYALEIEAAAGSA
ncbi:peptide ABC transporter ATP-binding protein [Acidihalobacter ferrooxydans]|uniref:Dipeptide ABC transporter ATP-binding protein n=1 Tax=Acidihalobacter ferrooxydans TaxID=1765967 RepID=A0A1P8UK13_9GAMM|nr:peptide ABC transporter ATP-binding protein [Acidihalobacter ferrooxydans]APZ44171.1 dipeptide ABC transporter ATP-binding protein [Acidihalobacter ferrooxydans]